MKTIATLLIVDDQPTNREYLVTLLGHKDHRLLEATDGAEALTVAQAEQPDLIITDVLMPTMDGYEFVRRLRLEPTLTQTPIIFYTAQYLEQEARALAEACGVTQILVKPSKPAQVLKTVEVALRSATPPDTGPLTEIFDRQHLHLLTDKLSKTVEELTLTNERLSALIEVSQNLTAELDPQRLLQSFCQAARDLIRASYATVSVMHEGERPLRYSFRSGLEAETAAHLDFLLPRPDILDILLTQRRPYCQSNPSGQPEAVGFPASHPPIYSLLAVPLMSPTYVYGWLGLFDKVGAEAFSPTDEQLAATLANLAGRVYENRQLWAEVRHHAEKLEQEMAERLQVEETLQRREQEFRSLAENVPDIIVRFDRHLRHLYINHQVEAKTGLPPSAFLGRTNREVGLPEQVVDYWDEKLRQVFETGQADTIEFEFLTPHGPGYFEARLIPETGREGSIETVLVINRDITKRKQAEAELRKSEERFRVQYQGLPLPTFSWQKIGEELELIDYNWAATGFTQNRIVNFVGRTVREMYQDRPDIVDDFRRCFTEQATFKREMSYQLRSTGEFKDVIVTYAYVPPDLVVVHIEDITGRKRAEEQFRLVVEGSPHAIILVGQDGKIHLVNAQAETLFGYSREELLGQTVEMLVPEPFHSQHRRDREAFWSAPIARPMGAGRDLFGLRKDGSQVPLEIGLNPIDTPEGTVVLASVIDITERKLAEAALRANQERLRQIIVSISDHIYVTEVMTEGTLKNRYISPNVESLTGYGPEKFMTDWSFWRSLIHPTHRRIAAAQLRRLHQGQSSEVEYRLTRADGETIWVRDSGRVEHEDQAKIIYGVVSNITPRKQAEEALHRYAKRLRNLHEIDIDIVAAQSSAAIAQTALKRLSQLIPCHQVSVTLFDFETQELVIFAAEVNPNSLMQAGLRQPLEPNWIAALKRGQTLMVEDTAALAEPVPWVKTLAVEEIRSYLDVPLMAGDELMGVLNLASDHPGAFNAEHTEIAEEITKQLAVAFQQAHLREQVNSTRERLEALSHRLLEAQETERRHIARELHDEIGQNLSMVKIDLQTLQQLPQVRSLAAQFDESISIVERTLQQARALSVELRPSLLDDLGLIPALRWYLDRQAQRGGFAARFVVNSLEARLTPELETVCYRLVQEALTNVVRYAQASQVEVELQQREAELWLFIRDDGLGFDVAAALKQALQGRSLGLLSMQERVSLIGGQLDIESTPGQGTVIRVRLPLRHAPPIQLD